MTRLVFSGILEKYPNLKFITHHCGGMVPYYAQRIHQHYGSEGETGQATYLKSSPRPPSNTTRCSTPTRPSTGIRPALMLAYDFWGAGNMVFGADMPLGDYYQASGATDRPSTP